MGLPSNLNSMFPNFKAAKDRKTDFAFVLSERAGNGEAFNSKDKFAFGLDLGQSPMDATFNYDENPVDAGNGTPYIPFQQDTVRAAFVGPVTTGSANKTKGFTSERGSVFESKDGTTVKFKISQKVVPVSFTFSQGE